MSTRHARRRWGPAVVEAVERRVLLSAVIRIQPGLTYGVAGVPFREDVTLIGLSEGYEVTADTNAPVTLTVEPGSTGAAVRGPTSSTVAAVHGVATFTGLSATVVGTYFLRFSTPGVDNATAVVYVLPGPPASLVVSGLPTRMRVGTADNFTGTTAVVVGTVDAYGNTATAATDVTLAASEGTAATRSAAAGGYPAVFAGLPLTRAVPQTLTVSAPGLAAVVSAPIPVDPGSGVAFTAVPPVGVVAGQPLAGVTVSVDDAYGNLATAGPILRTVYVDLLSTATGQDLATETHAVTGGQVTVLAGQTLTTTGTYVIRLTDRSVAADSPGYYVTPLATVDLPAFAVAPAAADHVAVTVDDPYFPTAVNALSTEGGRTLSPLTLTLTDPYGNVVPTDGVPVTVAAVGTVVTGPAQIGGTTTVATTAGRATFADLSVAVAGRYAITWATPGGLASAAIPLAVLPPVFAAPTVVAGRSPGVASVDAFSLFPDLNPRRPADQSVSFELYRKGKYGSVVAAHGRAAFRRGVATFHLPVLRAAGQYVLAMTAGDSQVIERDLTVQPDPARLTAVFVRQYYTSYRGTVRTALNLRDRFGNTYVPPAGVTATVTYAGRGPAATGSAAFPFDSVGTAYVDLPLPAGAGRVRVTATAAGARPAVVTALASP